MQIRKSIASALVTKGISFLSSGIENRERGSALNPGVLLAAVFLIYFIITQIEKITKIIEKSMSA